MVSSFVHGHFICTWSLISCMVISFVHGHFVRTWSLHLDMVTSFVHGHFVWSLHLYMVAYFVHGNFIRTWSLHPYMITSSVHGHFIHTSSLHLNMVRGKFMSEFYRRELLLERVEIFMPFRNSSLRHIFSRNYPWTLERVDIKICPFKNFKSSMPSS